MKKTLVFILLLALFVAGSEDVAFAKRISGKILKVNVKEQTMDIGWTSPLNNKPQKGRVIYTKNTKFENVSSPAKLKENDRVIVDCTKDHKTYEWMASRVKRLAPGSLDAKFQSFIRGK